MYYYYDILLNFQDESNLYEFYEWEETDDIEFIKKIPLFRLNTSSLKDIMKYKVKFSKEILNEIKNKTIVKSSSQILKNTFLVSDTKNALALELDDNGVVCNRSKLLLNDELNLNEIMFTMKEKKLEYEKLEKYKKREEMRQIAKIKRLINCEIDTLTKSKNESKLKYIYYEWFNEWDVNVEHMVKKMKNELKKHFDSKQQEIYNLIRKSYHKVI